MLQFAFERVNTLYVIVCTTPHARPSGQDRARWLQQIFPAAEVILTNDSCEWHHPGPCVADCTQKWVERTRQLVTVPIDQVFASEEYLERFALSLGATAVEFDSSRQRYPVSGTAVRMNLAQHWTQLHPVVRAGMCRKVTVMGAESTGTTTLANDLALQLSSKCVPEVGRTVSWELMAAAGLMENVNWTSREFWRILTEHANCEEAARHAVAFSGLGSHCPPWFVADTDALATVAWWHRYLGDPPASVVEFANCRLADAYIITTPVGIPFVQDGIRDGEELRSEMTAMFTDLARQSGQPMITVEGDRLTRLSTAAEFLASLP